MEKKRCSTPISLRNIQVSDPFWKSEMELVRQEVIPYQWAALNDKVEGAAPSYCMRNFKIAGKMNQEKSQQGDTYKEPSYTYRGFEALPKDPEHLEDMFYGFLFQDSDFSKWIEAVGYSLTQHPDPELEKLADGAIDIVCAAQQEDGYLDTYYIINGKDKIFSNLRDHHELYCFGHLTEGAIAYYEATGKDKLLQAAKRFADYIDNHFGPEEDKCKGYPGHEIAEMALVRLYEATGDKKYLDLSSFFVEQRGKRPYYFDQESHTTVKEEDKDKIRYAYHQAHLPVREQNEAVGHAVRAVYLYSGMADVARLTDDASLKQACETLWDDIVNKKMYITGGIGGTHVGEAFSYAYDLPNDTAYAETCASIGLMFFARRMLEMEPKSNYADVMELALYNGVLSGMALDGKSFFYVNPLEVNPIACHEDERKAHVKPVRQKWFGCACCPPNVVRLLSSLGAYAYTESEKSLFVHLYIGADITKKVGDKEVAVRMTSTLPWESKVSIEVEAEGTDFVLALRIPDWARGYTLEQSEIFDRTEKDGYLYLEKDWKGVDTIDIDFHMEPVFYEAHTSVREDLDKVALKRGPLVYCLEGVDNGCELHLLQVDVNDKVEQERCQIDGVDVVALKASGYRDKGMNESQGIYRPVTAREKEAVTLTYVPYFSWANRGENEMQVWTRYK